MRDMTELPEPPPPPEGDRFTDGTPAWVSISSNIAFVVIFALAFWLGLTT